MIAAAETLLSCRQVTKRFGGVLALDRLDLDIGRREFFGIIGPNGSGKTTFFNVLTGIFSLTAGSLIYEGRDVSNFSPQQVYRAGISRTFQRSRMSLGLSIFDNLMVGNHRFLNHGVAANLFNRKVLYRQLAEMTDQARALVMTFDPKLAQRMDEPMGNQPMIDRRRIEICRALIGRPKLLLLDEPSAGMTPREMRELMDNLLEVKKQIGDLTIILIEHEMSIIERITDRCAVFNFGRKLCEGSYANVVAEEQVREAYLGTSAKR